jgi:hypothetical protein
MSQVSKIVLYPEPTFLFEPIFWEYVNQQAAVRRTNTVTQVDLTDEAF